MAGMTIGQIVIGHHIQYTYTKVSQGMFGVEEDEYLAEGRVEEVLAPLSKPNERYFLLTSGRCIPAGRVTGVV